MVPPPKHPHKPNNPSPFIKLWVSISPLNPHFLCCPHCSSFPLNIQLLNKLSQVSLPLGSEILGVSSKSFNYYGYIWDLNTDLSDRYQCSSVHITSCPSKRQRWVFNADNPRAEFMHVLNHLITVTSKKPSQVVGQTLSNEITFCHTQPLFSHN